MTNGRRLSSYHGGDPVKHIKNSNVTKGQFKSEARHFDILWHILKTLIQHEHKKYDFLHEVKYTALTQHITK